jgi:hypothetical protein
MMSLRRISAEAKLSEEVTLDALARVIPKERIEAAVDAWGVREERERKLPASLTVLLCIFANLYAHLSLTQVFFQMVHGLRWLWPDRTRLRISKGGVSRARYRLGARPLETLFHQICRPLATPQTPGAFRFGLRLMALDSSTVDLADTPANQVTFGRPANGTGVGPWPQARLLALSECATHAIVDADLWPYAANQHAAARCLLRSLTPTMLLLWDQGLHSYDLIAATRARKAHVLGRLPATAKPELLWVLSDGTSLVRIYPTTGKQRRQRAIILRRITYTVDDPQRPGHRLRHRLITSLLDPTVAPAEALILAYHDRWEHELVIDEIETHQRPRTPLRSQLPTGVIQEVYALLLAHYLVRAVMADAAPSVDLPPTRLSFQATLQILRATLPDFVRSDPSAHPWLYQAMLEEITATPLPPRTERINPRVVKRKTCAFNAKRAHHRRWPQPTKPFREAITLLK